MAFNIVLAGPPPMINSTLQGVAEAARASVQVDKIYARLRPPAHLSYPSPAG